MSELAREKLKDAAFFLIYRVIVDDFREQARPYIGRCLDLRLFRLQLYVLRGFQQITAVLNEQVQGIDNVGNVFEVGVFEGQAGESFEQVRGCADALMGGGLDVFGVGFGVDEKWVGVGEVGA